MGAPLREESRAAAASSRQSRHLDGGGGLRRALREGLEETLTILNLKLPEHADALALDDQCHREPDERHLPYDPARLPLEERLDDPSLGRRGRSSTLRNAPAASRATATCPCSSKPSIAFIAIVLPPEPMPGSLATRRLSEAIFNIQRDTPSSSGRSSSSTGSCRRPFLENRFAGLAGRGRQPRAAESVLQGMRQMTHARFWRGAHVES